MKMIASRQLAAKPKQVWTLLSQEGSVVITKDGKPRAIVTPTSDETLVEDLEDVVFRRARRAVSAIRREAAVRALDKLTMAEIDAEIATARSERRARTAA